VWALPNLPATEAVSGKARHHFHAAGAELLMLDAAGHDQGSVTRLDVLYADARAEEWAAFTADCDKFLAEIDKGERIGKYTLAELEEEEQSLDRLRRWYRDLRVRDLLGTPPPADADQYLKRCSQRFDQYAERVYALLASAPSEHQTTPETR
jgi:hypothetical protein